jgi:hypothetical protein
VLLGYNLSIPLVPGAGLDLTWVCWKNAPEGPCRFAKTLPLQDRFWRLPSGAGKFDLFEPSGIVRPGAIKEKI